MSLLQQTKVGALVASKKALLDVTAETSVRDVLALLEGQRVLSVPVYGRPGGWLGAGGATVVAGGKQYIGVVSVADLVAFAFEHGVPMTTVEQSSSSPSSSTVASNAAAPTSVPGADPVSLSNILSRPVSQAIGATNESLSLWVESADAPLLSAMEQFSKGVHRILVFPEENFSQMLGGAGAATSAPAGSSEAVRLLTQTDVVQFLLDKSSSTFLGRLFDAPLSTLDLASDRKKLEARKAGPAAGIVKCVAASAELLTALRDMVDAEVHGVAVVDEAGRIVSTLSLSDLRGVVAPTLPALVGVSVSDFLKRQASGRAPAATGVILPAPLSCALNTPLRQAVAAMLQRKVHRIFVVDGATGLPGDVVTLTDVIACAYREERDKVQDPGPGIAEETKKRANSGDITGDTKHPKM